MPSARRPLSSITRALAALFSALLASVPMRFRREASSSWQSVSSWNLLSDTTLLTLLAVVGAIDAAKPRE